MKVVYVAGPFRARTPWGIEKNIRKAEELALSVWKLGAAAICPHANTRFFQNECPDQLWLDGDLEMVRRCDAVILTPDWETSVGAKTEREVAVGHGIPVFYGIDDLQEWLECSRTNTTTNAT